MVGEGGVRRPLERVWEEEAEKGEESVTLLQSSSESESELGGIISRKAAIRDLYIVAV